MPTNETLVLGDQQQITTYVPEALFPIQENELGILTWNKISVQTLRAIFNRNTVFPEDYSAVGDGIVNDTTALSDALTAAKDKSLVLTGNYKITSKIAVSLADKNIEVIFIPGSKITTTYTTSTGTISSPDALVTFSGGGTVKINDLTLAAYNTGQKPELGESDGKTLCGLLITGCSKVILENVSVSNAIYAGILLVDNDIVSIINCEAINNLYAGMLVRRCKSVNVSGGNYSYNGINTTYGGNPYSAGYGLAFTQAINSALGLNQDILVSGVTANYNKRIGLDAHQANRIKFIGNHVKGYGRAGFACENQGYEFQVVDLTIDGNTVEQDPDWYEAETTEIGATTPLKVGSYGVVNNLTSYSGGTIKVINNIFKNNSAYRSGTCYTDIIVFCWGSRASNIQIANNSLDTGVVKQAILLGLGNTATSLQPDNCDISNNQLINITASLATDNNNAMICVLAGKQVTIKNNSMLYCETTGTGNAGIKVFNYGDGSDINVVNIDNNDLSGTFGHGIYVSTGNFAKICNNLFNGTFTTFFQVESDMQFSIYNNFAKDLFTITGIEAQGLSTKLPDYLNKSMGRAEYAVEVGATTPAVIDTLTVNADEYEDGGIIAKIKIIAGAVFNLNSVEFEYVATAGNAAHSVTFDTPFLTDASAEKNNPITLKPTLTWNGSGSTRTLRMSLPTDYFAYKISIEFICKYLTPYQQPS